MKTLVLLFSIYQGSGRQAALFTATIREITDFDRFKFFPPSSVLTFYLKKKSLNRLRTSVWNVETQKKNSGKKKKTGEAVFPI